MSGALLAASLVYLPALQASAQTAPEPAAPDPAAAAPSAGEPTAEAPPVDAPAATEPAADPAAALPPANRPRPPPYSLPFQLRPVVAVSVVRSDTAVAFYSAPRASSSGSTVASTLLFSYKVTEDLAPLVRLGVVSNSPPAGDSGFGFMNPVVGATYALKLSPELRLGLFLGLTVPVGSGGGDEPSPEMGPTRTAGIHARSAMDNAMFAVNDLTVFPGVGLAYVARGFTAQVEATVLQLMRVRGEDAQPDASKTNFTAGLHLGYFIVPMLSIGTELRHQRWISTPVAVQNDASRATRETTTVAFGPRGHFKLGETMWLRPAIAFAMGLDDPMRASEHKILQIDVPFAF
ncbi:hypothetical protein [Sorangium sp. So ce1078]|uniref:hypothetical protein n=1 Tax=Sorangium sp. So ce1078 TaxID=3133329 RepID=UPI003F5D94D6